MTGDRSSRAVPDVAAIEAAGATDRGTVRTENQDAWDAAPLGDGRLVLTLADGMGGHAGGGEAADAAVAAVIRCLHGAAEDGDDDARGLLQRAVERATTAVAHVRDDLGGMPGTTLVTAIVGAGRVTVANVGDSRAYLVSGAAVTPLSTDHTWVGEEVAAGRLTPGAERQHPRRNVISRAVMGDPVETDIVDHPWSQGDVLLLCSDGVWEPVLEAQMAAVLAAAGPLEDLAVALCEAAITAGSRDNVTAVLARGVR